jgi:Tol biopolymer transport system component
LDPDNSSLALSPDGQRLVIAASSSDGKGQQLWLRSMDSLTIQPLPGTTGATYPFWSPDSRYVGFFADKKLKKIDITTGAVQALCDAPEGRGASWSNREVIVFAPAAFGPLLKIPAVGGIPAQMTSVDKSDITNRNPHFLPDGQRLLFYSGSLLKKSTMKGNGIYSLNLETNKIELVAAEISEGIYVHPGYLVFIRDGNLMAQPIDNKTLHTTGQAVPIAEHVLFNPDRATGAYSLSDTGLLVFQDGSGIGRTQLTWFDAIGGDKLGSIGEPAGFVSVAISPDGRRTQTKVRGSDAHFSLWIYDLTRGVGTRLTSGSVDFSSLAWSSDGRQVAYTSNEDSASLYLQPSDASLEPQKIPLEQTLMVSGSWSPNGDTIIFTTQSLQGGDLWIQHLTGDKKAYPFIVTPANEIAATISPDGRWAAFTSDENGRPELYVTSFPSAGVKRQITSDGADAPQWLSGGREIAYINAERKLKIVKVEGQGNSFDIGESRVLFGGKPLPALPHHPEDWDVPVYITSDGKRILLPVPIQGDASRSLTLVTNWTAALQK